jgi:glycosyltransferase involved in cell wall biosynthesis
MKIAILIYSLDRIGGIAKHCLLLAQELEAMGHQVTIWSVEFDSEHCYPELSRKLTIQSLRKPQSSEPDRKIDYPGIRMMNYLSDLWKFFQDQRRLSLAIPPGYDVVNPHGANAYWAAVEYKKRCDTPIVWMCNDFCPVGTDDDIGSNPSKLARTKLFLKKSTCFPFIRYDRSAVCAIEKIVILSEKVRCQIQEHYGVDAVVVRTGVEYERFTSNDANSSGIQRISNSYRFVLLTVCILMPRRRVEDVIRAVSILANKGIDVSFIIVGRTTYDPAYTEFIKNEITVSNLTNQVLLVGEVSDSELVSWFHACDAFVWSADENQSWGMAGLEAMASGKPLIVSKGNGLAEILEDEKTALLVKPNSPQALAGAIERLMNDAGLVNDLVFNGKRLVRENYTWRSNAEKMVNIFQEAQR